MKGYIYKYTFPNGKIYIGQTRRPIQIRHAEHLNPSTGPFNPGFWEAYQTVGTPFLTILETIEANDVTDLVEQLNRRETAYIFIEKATDPAYGYNKKTIATTYSPDINILKKEFYRICWQLEEEKKPFFDMVNEKLLHGKKDDFTDDEKAFVEEYIDHNNFFVHSVDFVPPIDEEMIQEGESFIDEEDTFMLEEAIDYAIWRYNEETHEIIGQYISENAEEILRRAKQGKIIQQLDLEGNVIREFESQDEIREAFNIRSLNNITNVIKGKQKAAYGFTWRYKPISDED